MTREVYLQVTRKYLACNRWELANTVKQRLRESQRDTLDKKEIHDIIEQIVNVSQEKYREDACILFNVPLPPGETYKKIMHKAYLVYSTLSSIRGPNGEPIRARWSEQINHEHIVHTEIIDKIA